jgi:hypothetical protein
MCRRMSKSSVVCLIVGQECKYAAFDKMLANHSKVADKNLDLARYCCKMNYHHTAGNTTRECSVLSQKSLCVHDR